MNSVCVYSLATAPATESGCPAWETNRSVPADCAERTPISANYVEYPQASTICGKTSSDAEAAASSKAGNADTNNSGACRSLNRARKPLDEIEEPCRCGDPSTPVNGVENFNWGMYQNLEPLIRSD